MSVQAALSSEGAVRPSVCSPWPCVSVLSPSPQGGSKMTLVVPELSLVPAESPGEASRWAFLHPVPICRTISVARPGSKPTLVWEK